MNVEHAKSAITGKSPYDLVVIGGGINGVGIARDAVGRGLKVLICEADDLAQHTSSASTKLIHGGLRYLEHYDFSLVRHALIEREVLLRSAPHIIWPMRFVLPHHKALRPRWMIRLGLFLYDHLGGRKLLPPSNGINLRKHIAGQALKPEFTRAFEYSDCWVQDARLVVLNAISIRELGGEVLTRTRCVDLKREQALWRVSIKDSRTGLTSQVTALSIVNAAGPWVEEVLNLSLNVKTDENAGIDTSASSSDGVRLVKGSHIIVNKRFDHPFAYIFQNEDDRVIFAIPYESEYTLIGTTDVEYNANPADTKISPEEIDYLCQAVNEYFAEELSPQDVVTTYSGVRPLYDDAAADASHVTRDYVLRLDDAAAPVVSVFGGKITTYRRLAEEVVDMLLPGIGAKAAPWTAESTLPGGHIADADFDSFVDRTRARFTWLPDAQLVDYCRNYGDRIDTLLKGCRSVADLGQHFGELLYQQEVEFLIQEEWAVTAEDILWRRTKKGLTCTAQEVSRLEVFLQQALP